MDAYLTAIMTKTTGSAFSTAVGGRIYLDAAPDKATFPYCVLLIPRRALRPRGDGKKDQREDHVEKPVHITLPRSAGQQARQESLC